MDSSQETNDIKKESVVNANEPKAETVNEKDEKEEKTSNGNHTPVWNWVECILQHQLLWLLYVNTEQSPTLSSGKFFRHNEWSENLPVNWLSHNLLRIWLKEVITRWKDADNLKKLKIILFEMVSNHLWQNISIYLVKVRLEILKESLPELLYIFLYVEFL